MSANTFTLEAAAAANIQVVGSDKGSQAVHVLIVAYQANRRTCLLYTSDAADD